MKTIIKISMLALAVVFVQACGSKSKEATSAVASATASQEAKDAQALKEKQEAIKKREEAQQERLKVAAAKRAAAEKYYKDDSGVVIYNKAEVEPTFPGGEKAMMKYFEDNLKYPTEAEAKGWEGSVYIDFIIGTDGKVRNSMVTDETDADVDNSFKTEAVRVVDNMPKWIPGRQLGVPVHVRFNLPVAFRMI